MKDIIELVKEGKYEQAKKLMFNVLDGHLEESLASRQCVLEGSEEVLEERYKKKVDSKGKVRKKRVCPSGYKASGNKCVRISSKEKLSRKKGQRKRKRTIKSKGSGYKSRVNRKRKKALRKRKSRGL